MLPIAIIIVISLLIISSGIGYAVYVKNKKIVCPKYAKCTNTTFACPNGFTKTATGCDCNGYITMDGDTPVCNICPDYARCSDTGFTCPSGFIKGENSCVCPSSNYITGSGSTAVCGPCPTNAVCQGTNTFSCPDNKFVKSTNSCECPNGYVSKINGVSSCNICPTNASCDSSGFHCNNGYVPSGTSCICPATGYINVLGSCVPCPTDALCSGNVGYSCPTGFTTLPNSQGCACTGTGLMKLGTGSTLRCSKCETDNSKLCSDDGTSFTCKPNYSIARGDCLCYGGTGYINNGVCTVCPQYAVCNGTGYNCSYYGFTNINGVCMCPSGYISYDGTNYRCITPCPDHAVCSPNYSPTGYQCTSPYTIMPDGSCQCYGGTGYKDAGNVCQLCPQYAVCNGYTYNCSYYGFTDINGACMCPSGYISYDGTNYRCITPCPSNAICNNIFSDSNPTGYTCNTGFRNTSGSCACSGYILPLSGTGTTINNVIGTTCDTCPIHATCTNNNLSCINGFTRVNSGNSYSCNCMSGYITGTGSSQVCNQCPNYATCDGNTFTCLSNLTKASDGTCKCPNNSLIITNSQGPLCSPCPSYGICNGTDTIVCPPGFNSTNLGCVCATGMYIDTTGSCVKCPDHATCGGVVGFNCPPPLITRNNTCICPDGQTIVGGINSAACSILPTTAGMSVVYKSVTVLGKVLDPVLANNVVNPYVTTFCGTDTNCPSNTIDKSAYWIWINSETPNTANTVHRFTKVFNTNITQQIRITLIIYNVGTVWFNDQRLGVVNQKRPVTFTANMVAGDNFLDVDAIRYSVTGYSNGFAGICGMITTVPAAGAAPSTSSIVAVTDSAWNTIPLSTSLTTCPTSSSRTSTGVDTGIMGCKCDPELFWDPINYRCSACTENSALSYKAPNNPLVSSNEYEKNNENSSCRCSGDATILQGGKCVVCPYGSYRASAGASGELIYQNPENPNSLDMRCNCNTADWFNTGSNTCDFCPAFSTLKGTGMTVPTKPRCKCLDVNHYWNGTDCSSTCPLNSTTDNTGNALSGSTGLNNCKCNPLYYSTGSSCARCPSSSRTDGSGFSYPGYPACLCPGGQAFSSYIGGCWPMG